MQNQYQDQDCSPKQALPEVSDFSEVLSRTIKGGLRTQTRTTRETTEQTGVRQHGSESKAMNMINRQEVGQGTVKSIGIVFLNNRVRAKIYPNESIENFVKRVS